MSAQPNALPDGVLKSEQVMRVLGYADRSSFWKAVKRDGVPYIRVNRRRIVFEAVAIRSWLDSRTVTGQRGKAVRG